MSYTSLPQADEGEGSIEMMKSNTKGSFLVNHVTADIPLKIEDTKSDKNNGVKDEKSGFMRYFGIASILVSSFLLSCVNLLAKCLVDSGVEAYSVSFYRYLGIMVPSMLILFFMEMRSCWVSNTPFITSSLFPFTENWKTWLGLLSRGIFGSSSALLRFMSLVYLPVGDAAVISYSNPVMVIFLAHIFLGEGCGVVPTVVSLSTLVGVTIIARPPLLTGEVALDTQVMIGVALASGSALCAALRVIITRKLRKLHFSLMQSVFGFIGLVQAIVMAYTLGGGIQMPRNISEALMVFGVAFLSFGGQLGAILALKYEKAGPVAVLRTTDVVYSFILQFLHIVPDVHSGVGSSIVFLGVVVIALRKCIGALPKESCGAKLLGWTLL